MKQNREEISKTLNLNTPIIARECFISNSLKVSDMWEMGYDRDDAKKAFENKVNGIDKGRTYLKWI